VIKISYFGLIFTAVYGITIIPFLLYCCRLPKGLIGRLSNELLSVKLLKSKINIYICVCVCIGYTIFDQYLSFITYLILKSTFLLGSLYSCFIGSKVSNLTKKVLWFDPDQNQDWI